jgi:hypothetical protein
MVSDRSPSRFLSLIALPASVMPRYALCLLLSYICSFLLPIRRLDSHQQEPLVPELRAGHGRHGLYPLCHYVPLGGPFPHLERKPVRTATPSPSPFLPQIHILPAGFDSRPFAQALFHSRSIPAATALPFTWAPRCSGRTSRLAGRAADHTRSFWYLSLTLPIRPNPSPPISFSFPSPDDERCLHWPLALSGLLYVRLRFLRQHLILPARGCHFERRCLAACTKAILLCRGAVGLLLGGLVTQGLTIRQKQSGPRFVYALFPPVIPA